MKTLVAKISIAFTQMLLVLVALSSISVAFPLVEAAFRQNPVKTALWVQSPTFPSDVGRYSPMFEKVIRGFRLIATTRNAFDNMKEASPKNILVRTRKGFAVNATLSKWGDNWAITVDKADPLEHGHPNILDILGRTWRLVRHVPTYSAAGERTIIAEGAIE